MSIPQRERATLPYRDRRDAGRELAGRLSAYANRQDVIVVALPREECQSRVRSRSRSRRRSISFSCASSVCPVRKSSRWARSHQEECAYSMRTSFASEEFQKQ